MSVSKSEIKAATLKSLGENLVKRRDEAEKDVWKYQGAKSALQQMEEKFNLLCTAVRNDIIKAGAELPFDPKEPVEVGQFINEKLMKGSQAIHEAITRSYDGEKRSEGKKKGLNDAIEQVESQYKEELAKDEARKAAEKGEPVGGTIPGVHPGPTLKEQRQAEEAKAKAKPKPKVKGKPKAKPAKPAPKKAKAKGKPKAKK